MTLTRGSIGLGSLGFCIFGMKKAKEPHTGKKINIILAETKHYCTNICNILIKHMPLKLKTASQ